jgi:hypothetical protein
MATDQPMAEAGKSSALGPARLLVGLLVVIAFLGIGLVAFQRFVTVQAFPPTMESVVAKDGDGWLMTVHFRNKAGETAEDLILTSASLGGLQPKEAMPIRVGDIPMLGRRQIQLHFGKPKKSMKTRVPIVMSYNVGKGGHAIGMTTETYVNVP